MFRLFLLTYGAGEETRTLDPNLGKVVLYQLSYSRTPSLVLGSRFSVFSLTLEHLRFLTRV